MLIPLDLPLMRSEFAPTVHVACLLVRLATHLQTQSFPPSLKVPLIWAAIVPSRVAYCSAIGNCLQAILELSEGQVVVSLTRTRPLGTSALACWTMQVRH